MSSENHLDRPVSYAIPSATIASAIVSTATVPTATVPTATAPTAARSEPIKTSKRKESSEPSGSDELQPKNTKKAREAKWTRTWIELQALVASNPDKKMTKQDVLDSTVGFITFAIEQLPGGKESLPALHAAFWNSQRCPSNDSLSYLLSLAPPTSTTAHAPIAVPPISVPLIAVQSAKNQSDLISEFTFETPETLSDQSRPTKRMNCEEVKTSGLEEMRKELNFDQLADVLPCKNDWSTSDLRLKIRAIEFINFLKKTFPAINYVPSSLSNASPSSGKGPLGTWSNGSLLNGSLFNGTLFNGSLFNGPLFNGSLFNGSLSNASVTSSTGSSKDDSAASMHFAPPTIPISYQPPHQPYHHAPVLPFPPIPQIPLVPQLPPPLLLQFLQFQQFMQLQQYLCFQQHKHQMQIMMQHLQQHQVLAEPEEAQLAQELQQQQEGSRQH